MKEALVKRIEVMSKKEKFAFVDPYRRLYNELSPVSRMKVAKKIMVLNKKGKQITYREMMALLNPRERERAKQLAEESNEVLNK